MTASPGAAGGSRGLYFSSLNSLDFSPISHWIKYHQFLLRSFALMCLRSTPRRETRVERERNPRHPQLSKIPKYLKPFYLSDSSLPLGGKRVEPTNCEHLWGQARRDFRTSTLRAKLDCAESPIFFWSCAGSHPTRCTPRKSTLSGSPNSPNPHAAPPSQSSPTDVSEGILTQRSHPTRTSNLDSPVAGFVAWLGGWAQVGPGGERCALRVSDGPGWGC